MLTFNYIFILKHPETLKYSIYRDETSELILSVEASVFVCGKHFPKFSFSSSFLSCFSVEGKFCGMEWQSSDLSLEFVIPFSGKASLSSQELFFV